MVKVISLSNEAYRILNSIKNGRSFSEVVVNLVENKKDKKDIMKFAGAFVDNSDEWEKIKNRIYSDRKKFKLREVRF